MAYQHVTGPDHHQLVSPQDTALRVDNSDAIAIPIQADAQVTSLLPDNSFQLLQVILNRWVGMMVGKGPVNFFIE